MSDNGSALAGGGGLEVLWRRAALRSGSFTLSRGEIIDRGRERRRQIHPDQDAPVYQDSGRLLVRGEPVALRNHNVSHMRQLGIEVVYQDLAIVPNMSAPFSFSGASRGASGYLWTKAPA